MITIIRRYQQALMIFVTIMVIIAFVWFFNGTQIDQIGKGGAYKIYGRTYTQAEIEKRARQFGVALRLEMRDYVLGLGGNALDQNQLLENFVWNGFVIDEEAKKLGIHTTESQIIQAIQKIPLFQTNDVFDPVKYQSFLGGDLKAYGFTDRQFEELIAASLRLNRLKTLVGSTVDVTSAEALAAFTREHQKLNVSFISFSDAEFSKQATPTEEEITKFFGENTASLVDEERRSVSFAKIELSAEEQALEGKGRAVALQRVGDTAGAFSQAILEKGASFEEVAKVFNLPTGTTKEFNQTEPASEFGTSPAVAEAAFRLSEAAPNSDPIRSENGFYVLHLNKVIPSRALTLEEARPKIIELLKAEKGANALITKANETRAKLAESIQAGKSFKDAASSLGFTVEDFPSFSLAQPEQSKPFAQEIAQSAPELAEGSLSNLVNTSEGGLILYMNKREPIDAADFEKSKEQQLSNLRFTARYAAFIQWLALRKKEADPKSLLQEKDAANKAG